MSSSNEQFLFCAIEHSTNGVVDWHKVAEIFGIKDSAARMRYTRMKKKFGTFGAPTPPPGDDAADDGEEVKTPVKTPVKGSAKKGKANKKRKVEEEGDGAEVVEEEEVKGEAED
ncbi:hypothetical protein LTR01_007378 [Friedmanniomyces endolithicus]|nr:hypothetical protein LTR01_007378 [Friedmanniomyces endolithicus]